MSRANYRYLSENRPDLVEAYSDFINKSNIQTISKQVTSILKEHFPNEPPMVVPDDNIEEVMWEIFYNDPQHTQIMIQRTINLISNQVKSDEDLKILNDSYDPWIQFNPEKFGMTSYDNKGVKLNERRVQDLDFYSRR